MKQQLCNAHEYNSLITVCSAAKDSALCLLLEPSTQALRMGFSPTVEKQITDVVHKEQLLIMYHIFSSALVNR